MYVCLCRGVTDQAVVDAVRAGARSVSAVGRACGAGRTCGGCRPEIRRLLDSHVIDGGASLSRRPTLEVVGEGRALLSTPGESQRHAS